MSRVLVTAVAILLIGLKLSVSAQTLDALLHENRILRARLAAKQPQFVSWQGAFDEYGQHWHEDDDHKHSHESHHSQKHGCALAKGRCEPHFDYCFPFEDHHGGHGYCDLCRSGHASGYNGDEDHHGHAHGPAYHHSIDGYPMLHSARTEFFFVERHVHLRLADVRGADGGEVDELEFEAELVYALNDRLVLIGTVPVIHLNPLFEPSTTGVGDLEFGLRLLAFNGERDGLLFGLDVATPTGDPNRDLGGDTLLLPSANWVHDFGRGTYMFNVATWEMAIDVDQPEDLFLHDLVLLHTFLSTHDVTLFRYLTPCLEINTEAVINGPASGRTVVDATLGLTWLMGDENEVSVGWSFPLSGDRNFDNQLLFNFIKHL